MEPHYWHQPYSRAVRGRLPDAILQKSCSIIRNALEFILRARWRKFTS